MPRVRRRAKRRIEGYTEQEIMHLCHGYSVFYSEDRFYLPGHRHDHDDAALREAWGEVGPQLTEQWIQERPGSRPWSWWRYDAPEKRRRIDGLIHRFDDPIFQTAVELEAIEIPGHREREYELSFGVPRRWYVVDAGTRYEGELAFLDRHGLLTDFEKQELYGESENATSEA